MFSTPESLKRRTGQFGVSRFPYLQQLVCEYEDSSCSDEHKLQILANLANFAYDPINYDYIRQLNIIHLFMDCLKMNIEGYINENNSEQQQFLEYCIGGLCNLCLDNKNKLLILNDDCVLLSIIKCLCSNSINIVLNSMCLLMFLITDESKDKICSTQVIECLKQYKQSNDQRLANMAKVFLNEYCTEQNKMSSTFVFIMDPSMDVFDENSDDLTVASRDVQLLTESRYKDGFRHGCDLTEQDGYDDGFLYGYSLIGQLIFDYTYLKDKLKLFENINTNEILLELEQFENEMKTTIDSLSQNVNEQRSEYELLIKNLNTKLNTLQLKIEMKFMTI